MGDILRRRALMVLPSSSPTPEWDVEWDYTMGLPNDNGWTRDASGTNSITLQEDAVQLYIKNTSSRNDLIYPDSNTAYGVFEVVFTKTDSQGFFFVVLGNGTNGIGIRCQYSTNYKGFYLAETDGTLLTKLKGMSLNYQYTLRLVLKGGTADAYIDGVKVVEDFDISENGSAWVNTKLAYRAAGGSNTYAKLYSMKLKLGRT